MTGVCLSLAVIALAVAAGAIADRDMEPPARAVGVVLGIGLAALFVWLGVAA